MKTKLSIYTLIIATLGMLPTIAEAQPLKDPTPEEIRLIKKVIPTTPIGKIVYVSIAQNEFNTPGIRNSDDPAEQRNNAVALYNGTLILMTEDWIVLNTGNYEKWLPKSRVLLIDVAK